MAFSLKDCEGEVTGLGYGGDEEGCGDVLGGMGGIV